MSHTIVLGNPDKAERRELLREGAIEVRSRRGLRLVEALLIEALPARPAGRVLTGLDSEAAVAAAVRAVWGPEPGLAWWHLDAYVARKAAATLERSGVTGVDLRCQPDLPGARAPAEADEPGDGAAEPFDLVALPFPRGQEAILGRELVEEALAVLRPGGKLLAATDDPKGTWLKKVLKDVAGNVTIAHERRRKGMCLLAIRRRDRAEVRDHRHLIQAALRGRALELESRPGIFGHAGLDPGTRALAEAFAVEPADRVLDLGCGYGALTLAAAAAAPGGRVVGVDSNARAVRCTLRNARRNGLPHATALLRADLEDLGDEPFDVALANPPYFGKFRIAEAFVAAAADRLRPGGRLWLVAKAAAEHREIVAGRLTVVGETRGERGHAVIEARKSR